MVARLAASMLQKLDKQTLRNAMAFVAMVAICGCALFIVVLALERLRIEGIHRLTVAFAADACCGVLGYFLFSGSGSLRAVMMFFSVVVFGALMAFLPDFGGTIYSLLSSIPFAAVAAIATRVVGHYFEPSGKPDEGP